ncbi:hypothetical protein, variant 1 [Aphanomyces invadans]|uniref:Peptidase M14 domain-containing protein n=1 Tax=Aphanomyces invadans TaxID=157072 RepID=A0A024TN90_9STRA|nr:hypothetical protein, variant 1 [Aphanomyces invadans]ETV95473.1 hypothetical protein, variant 1 [Aphanomyces invadans]|eukprot:XP_008875666.1 hypothetical protein, variant 1 [Aphanomyces invadans]
MRGSSTTLVAALVLVASYEYATGREMMKEHTWSANVSDAHYGIAEAADIHDGCKWKRVWQANVTSDKNALSTHAHVNGPGFSIRATEGLNESAQVAFTLDSTTFPSQGKLVLRAQFPSSRGLRSTLKFVKHSKELVVVQGSSAHPTSLIVHPGSPRAKSIATPTTRLRLKDFPCFQENNPFTSSVHEFLLTWDSQWVRWHVDNVFFAEAPRPTSFFSTDDVHPLSLVVAVDLIPDNTTRGAQPDVALATDGSDAFVVQELLLMEQTSSACVPTLTNPNDCRQYAMAKSTSAFLPQIRSGSLEGSLSLEQVYEFVNDIVPDLLTDFPHLFRTEVIGTSVEGRPIVALCLGACHAPSPAPPQALYTALHHSREPMSMMNLVFFIDHLILGLRGHDPSITALLWSRQLWFVLVVNPDGYAYNEANMPKDPDETFSGQRKNRHKSTCSETADVGVDLNRNYDVCFSQDAVGSSDEACAEDYRGPAPFSEPETRAIRDFVDRHNFSTAFNYHSFGQYFNIPFACQPKGVPPPFATSVYNALAADMTSRNRFKFGQSWKESNLYSVNGETSDWMWQAHGIFAISPETGPSFDVDNFHGFWPSDPLVIHDICNELVHSNYVLAKWAGPQYALIMQVYAPIALSVACANPIRVTGMEHCDHGRRQSRGHHAGPLGSKHRAPVAAPTIANRRNCGPPWYPEQSCVHPTAAPARGRPCQRCRTDQARRTPRDTVVSCGARSRLHTPSRRPNVLHVPHFARQNDERVPSVAAVGIAPVRILCSVWKPIVKLDAFNRWRYQLHDARCVHGRCESITTTSQFHRRIVVDRGRRRHTDGAAHGCRSAKAAPRHTQCGPSRKESASTCQSCCSPRHGRRAHRTPARQGQAVR